MLKTIQIITLLQGFFLMLVLIKRKKEFPKVNFWLLLGTILSVQGYALGDDDFNLFVEDADWYFFWEILFLTFFILLIKYRNEKTTKFKIRDLWFFTPYLVMVIIKTLDKVIELNESIVKVGALLFVVPTFFYMIYLIRKVMQGKEKWLKILIIPYTIVFVVDHFSFLIVGDPNSMPFLESYGVIGLSALLFYVVLYRLVLFPATLIPPAEVKKYKTSSLNTERVEVYITQLHSLFEVDKVFINNKLTVNDVANEMNIPRQHLSELFSVHLNTNFQDYLNSFRVEEFIRNLQNPDYENLTLLGIAKEVGFNSKTSFYTTFKKVKGMTPLEYKKQMIE